MVVGQYSFVERLPGSFLLRDSDGERRGGDPLFVEIAEGRDKGPFTSSRGLQKMLFTGERFSTPR